MDHRNNSFSLPAYFLNKNSVSVSVKIKRSNFYPAKFFLYDAIQPILLKLSPITSIMMTSDNLKTIYRETSDAVLQAFKQSELQADSDNSPSQLIEAIDQFIIIYDTLGNQHSKNSLFNKESISQIGEQTINCLIELANWAERLHLAKEKVLLEEIAFTVAHWVIRHQGEIRSLEVIVNILATKANRTSDKAILSALFHVMNDVIEHAAPEFKNDLDKSEANRPWRMLNFNFAIVATRTMDKELMIKSFDTLGRNFPEDCPQFFEEGLRQSEKEVYGPEIKIMMAEYFKKWATLH